MPHCGMAAFPPLHQGQGLRPVDPTRGSLRRSLVDFHRPGVRHPEPAAGGYPPMHPDRQCSAAGSPTGDASVAPGPDGQGFRRHPWTRVFRAGPTPQMRHAAAGCKAFVNLAVPRMRV